MTKETTKSSAFPRTMRTAVLKASKHFPVVAVTGARQVGKTTLLQEISEPGRRYVSLDDPFFAESG